MKNLIIKIMAKIMVKIAKKTNFSKYDDKVIAVGIAVFNCVADYLKGDIVQTDYNVKYNNDCRLPKLGESVLKTKRNGEIFVEIVTIVDGVNHSVKKNVYNLKSI